jgi:hypothetical protein
MIDPKTMTDAELEATNKALMTERCTEAVYEQLRVIDAEIWLRRQQLNNRSQQVNGAHTPTEAAQKPKTKTTQTEGKKAIAEIKRIQAHAGGAPLYKVFTTEQHEARMTHVLEVANQTTNANKGESMSKPEPDPVLISEKAKDHMAQMKARGHKFYSISQAVAHVRKEMGLSTDTLATDADMARRANAQD